MAGTGPAAGAPAVLAVVGGGCSGTLLAVHLLRGARVPARVVLFELRGAPGRGVAYRTRSASHLLNVRSAGMSAFPDDPGHFVRWARGPGALPESAPTDFLPRRLYGAYLEGLLREAAAGAAPGVSLEIVQEAVVDLEEGAAGAVLRTAGGARLPAARVALALGNLGGGGPLSGSPAPLYAENPWDPAALEGLDRGDPVLVLGTGLTMVDLVLSLGDRGHRGAVHALSRRGLLPAAHAAGAPAPPVPVDPAAVPATPEGWIRHLRRAARGAPDWRPVVDGVRPHVAAIWASFGPAGRARFLRHARPFWDVHRHRMAPAVAAALEERRARGGLLVHAGRVRGVAPSRLGLRVRIAPRGGGAPREVDVARVINATGPESDLRRLGDPLVDALLARGAIRPDAHRLGLDAAPGGAVLDREGRPSERVHALGPLLRGSLWECTAVPEIRVQALDLARRWLAELRLGG